jgi:hypothetical protein
MIDKQKRLKEVYEHLRMSYGVHTQIDFARVLHYSRNAITLALNGNEKYLTDSLFKNICEAYPGVFNLDYLLTGKGSLLAGETANNDAFLRSMEAIDPSSFINAIIAAKDETIAAIREQLETKEQTISLLRQQIDILRQQLAEGSHHTTSMVAEEITKQETKK